MKRRVRLCAAVLLLVAACQQQASPQVAEILRISIAQDIVSFDPTQVHQPSVDESLIRNVFNGLYRFEDNLKEVPDLASGNPEVSTDAKTWTFHLRADAKFGNGDPVTADDVIFSWNRAAAVQNDNAFAFEPVVGFKEVRSGVQTTLAGLSAPDPKTVVARLSGPAAFWFAELGLWSAYVLNRRVLRDHGEQDWWKSSQFLNWSATGPFQLAAWEPGRSLDFKPTPNWWGGGTGTLSRVHAEIVSDPAAAVSRYEHGDFDIIGYAPSQRLPEMPIDSLKRLSSDHSLAGQLQSRPWLETLWLRFNTRSGPLAGAEGRVARKALSQAIDRKAFEAAACDGGITCVAATGGMFVPGLQGYLGDNKDPYANFDPNGAKAAIRSWDPDGTKARALRMFTFPNYKSLAQEVHRQWLANLGIDVPFDIVDSPPAQIVIAGGVNVADFDSPDNWLAEFVDSRFYSNAAFNAMEASANAAFPTEALPQYMRAEQLVQDDVVVAALAYRVRAFLMKVRVIGAGGNALYEYYWKEIRIKTD